MLRDCKGVFAWGDRGSAGLEKRCLEAHLEGGNHTSRRRETQAQMVQRLGQGKRAGTRGRLRHEARQTGANSALRLGQNPAQPPGGGQGEPRPRLRFPDLPGGEPRSKSHQQRADGGGSDNPSGNNLARHDRKRTPASCMIAPVAAKKPVGPDYPLAPRIAVPGSVEKHMAAASAQRARLQLAAQSAFAQIFITGDFAKDDMHEPTKSPRQPPHTSKAPQAQLPPHRLPPRTTPFRHNNHSTYYESHALYT